MPPECASGEGALVVARLAILPPLLSLISLLWAPMIFFGNTNPSALNQLLRELRVLLIMGQVTLRSGMVAVSTSSFPVAFELYSLPSGGISLFAATLIDCLFLPCAIIMFVSLDCAIVPAPRARCVLAFHFLYSLSTQEPWNFCHPIRICGWILIHQLVFLKIHHERSARCRISIGFKSLQ